MVNLTSLGWFCHVSRRPYFTAAHCSMASLAKLEHERLGQVSKEWKFNYKMKKSFSTEIQTQDLSLHSLPLCHLCYITMRCQQVFQTNQWDLCMDLPKSSVCSDTWPDKNIITDMLNKYFRVLSVFYWYTCRLYLLSIG